MMIDDRVAHNIKDVRHHRGLSQEVLATESGVSRAYMGRLENAKHSMTLLKLGRIANALEVDPLVLLLPRMMEKEQLASFIANQGGYIGFPQG
jgi:transcriptional regulator with XRE-family HTH domain